MCAISEYVHASERKSAYAVHTRELFTCAYGMCKHSNDSSDNRPFKINKLKVPNRRMWQKSSAWANTQSTKYLTAMLRDRPIWQCIRADERTARRAKVLCFTLRAENAIRFARVFQQNAYIHFVLFAFTSGALTRHHIVTMSLSRSTERASFGWFATCSHVCADVSL